MIEPSPYRPDTPKANIQRSLGSVAEVFGEFHERHVRNHRALTIMRAADWVLGERASQWHSNQGLRYEDRPYAIAIHTEEGLRRELVALDDLAAAGTGRGTGHTIPL